MGINVFDVSVASWNADAVEPQFGLDSLSLTVKLAASTTYPKGALLGELSATKGTFGLYVHSGTGGLGAWQCVLPRAVITDSSGNIFEGAQTPSEIPGESYIALPAWRKGAFKMGDLSANGAAFDANALADGPTGIQVLRGKVADGDAIVQF